MRSTSRHRRSRSASTLAQDGDETLVTLDGSSPTLTAVKADDLSVDDFILR